MADQKLDSSEVRIFSGSSHPRLAADIARYLEVPLEETKISRFSNDNLYIQLGASVRGRRVFIVQSLFPPVNDHLVELLMMLDIARSAAAIVRQVLEQMQRLSAGIGSRSERSPLRLPVFALPEVPLGGE